MMATPPPPPPPTTRPPPRTATTVTTPCKVRSAALELPLPEIRYRCRSLIARIGRCRWRPGHAAAVAAASSEFGYDPMSYALSFEDDRSRELDEEFPARNFSARLPLSPDRLLPVKS
ncbi:hypothetical protein EUGRSUZ_C01640 [Eucalyptus grandis]|uniref:Uncharacterized protein n=2 Tax=Eucalyptus grandis TaxID=71139 RepID=A0ACC3LDY4_EUCGR|nr:hypothetical protein EUGRSUZ_C01640 [Eucalyptus grandis]